MSLSLDPEIAQPRRSPAWSTNSATRRRPPSPPVSTASRSPTALLLNRAGADVDARVADLDAGLADVITVATMALANPDLPARIRSGAPLNEADPATFYGGDHRGYTDYPVLAAASN
ncbi:hypothetical protein [Actinoallomurus soli]|uniref:hypothetical protein n=1 Tax=Actinoallomurus soli TaxID=2952535 RepID=UPI003872EEF3